MAVDPDVRDPACERLTLIVETCEKRLRRAEEKRAVAQLEVDDAYVALIAARRRRTAHIAASPSPQPELF